MECRAGTLIENGIGGQLPLDPTNVKFVDFGLHAPRIAGSKIRYN